MIKVVGRARLVMIDPVTVKLKCFVTCINCHTAGTLSGNSLLKIFFIARCNVNKSYIPSSFEPISNKGSSVYYVIWFWFIFESKPSKLLWIISAYVLFSFIWVASLCINSSIVSDVLKCKVHESSITSIVPELSTAVNEILFAQTDQLSSLPKMHRFQCSGCGETPARSTITLYDTNVSLNYKSLTLAFTWSLTLVTAPSCLQSTFFGRLSTWAALRYVAPCEIVRFSYPL